MDSGTERDEEDIPKRSLWILGAAMSVLSVTMIARSVPRGFEDNALHRDLLGPGFGLDTGCWVPGVYYASPSFMADTDRSQEASPQKCQERCQRKYGCLHFTYWPDGGCFLSSSMSKLKATGLGFSDTLVGPRDCTDLSHYVEEFLSGSVYCDEKEIFKGPTTGQQDCQQRCDDDENCKWYSYWQKDKKHWCRLTEHCRTVSAEFHDEVVVYRKVSAKLQEAGLNAQTKPRNIGANGRLCKAYSACAAVNLTMGNCCPNNNRIHLRCCTATVDEAVQAVKDALEPALTLAK